MDELEYKKKVPVEQDETGPKDENRKKMNHEIRSISHGLLGYLAILSDEVEDKLDEEEKELLSRVKYYSHKLSDLVLELLSNNQQNQDPSEDK